MGVAVVIITSSPRGDADRHDRRRDIAGGVLLAICAVATYLAISSPDFLARNDVAGLMYAPIFPSSALSAFTTPMAVTAMASALLFAVREVTAGERTRPIVPLRRAPAVLRTLDWSGAVLLGGSLACVVITFASANPSVQVLGTTSYIMLGIGAVLAAAFVIREKTSSAALIPFGSLTDRAAIGAMLASLATGAALVTALVDIPVFARTVEPSSTQVGAAFVLLRLLVAVPAGALAGGVLSRHLGYRVTAGAGMMMTGIAFILMANWSPTVLTTPWLGLRWLHSSDVVLPLCGVGFGLAIAPLNAAMLQAVSAKLHGLAASLVVMSRMVGMLAGLSILTGLGLHSFYQAVGHLDSPQTLCPSSPQFCPAYDRLIENAGVSEMHTIFAGAAVVSLAAALLSFALLRRGSGGGAAPVAVAI
jgi:hypothetical protein